MKKTISLVLVVALGLAAEIANAATTNQAPIADAGSSRYAAQDPVVLDGTGSYDPDNSDTLTYTWEQIAGPPVIITDANTATPTIPGAMVPTSRRDPTLIPGDFPQTDAIQECKFELVVSDGELTSQPDTVKVVIVRDFSVNKLYQLNPPFDPNRPTLVGFAGVGGCQNCGPWTFWRTVDWFEKVNFITYEQFHASTYEKVGDMFIVYLSSQAPDYKQPIQTFGHSAGGEPAIDIAIYLNETYADKRYAVNHVALIDAAGYCRNYGESIERFLASAVDGEQCWIDNYSSTLPGSYGMKSDLGFHANVLNVWFDRATDNSFTVQQRHNLSHKWYRDSLIGSDMNKFNGGVIAGAYWSVVGPGKNLQLASTPDAQTYKFQWYGGASSGYMDYYDEPNHPGRLPEPVTLVEPVYTEDSNGIILTCQESENAVGYQLLFGPDPYLVMDYSIISDTPAPPNDVITMLPFAETWWTIKVRDQYGSTIYADPIPLYSYFASKPDPSDGALLTVTWAGLRWTVGVAIASHNVYFGDNIDDVSAGAEGTLLTSLGRSAVGVAVDNLIAETTYYWRIDSVEADGTIQMGDVWSFTLAPQAASDPIPADGAVFIGPIVTLSWARGLDATSHTVYIGENFDDVNNASEGTLQEDAIYTPEESLARGTVYYWRVDEFDGSDTHKGDVWSFETPPFIEITDPNLVAWWKLDGEYFDLGYVVDYSGYNHHGTPRGDVHPVEGYDGGAMEFDGSSDYINIDGYKGINADANGVQPAFSVSAWFKTTGNGEIVTWGSPFDGQRFTFRLNDGRLRTEHGNGNLQGDTTCNDGEWHNFTLTVPYDAPCDDPDTVIYLDGVVDSRVSTGTSNTYDLVARADVSIGRSATSGDRYFPGVIDDVRIYNVALSEEEIAALVQ